MLNLFHVWKIFGRQHAILAFFWLGQNCPKIFEEKAVAASEAASEAAQAECIGKMQKNSDLGQSKSFGQFHFEISSCKTAEFWILSLFSMYLGVRNKPRIFPGNILFFFISGGRDWNWDHRIHHYHLFEKGSDWKQDPDHFGTSSWIRIQNKAKWGKSTKSLQH